MYCLYRLFVALFIVGEYDVLVLLYDNRVGE